MGIWIEIILILILIIANGVFSMSETAVVSSRPARLQQRVDRGEAGASTAFRLTQHPNIFLATVQIGITLIGVLSGAFGGATAARSLTALVARIEPLAPYASQISLILVVVVITYLSLIIGELVPKRIALNNPEAIASRIAGPMSTLSRVGAPVVRLLSGSTDLLLRVLGVRQKDEPPVTAEEIGVLLEQGARAGVFEPAEQEMIEAVFDLDEDPVAALMTPRTSVDWLDLADSEDEQRQKILQSRHNRYPVCRNDIDDVVGIIRTKDLLNLHLQELPVNLEEAAHPALFVPESMSGLRLLEQFRRTQQQLAIVIDEFGGVAGVVSLQDVLESIVGDIPVLGADANPALTRRSDGSWLIDGAIPFDEAAEALGLDESLSDRAGYHTLAGFILDEIDHIPVTGEQFSAFGWRFEIIDMDGNRIDKVMASAAPAHVSEADVNARPDETTDR